VLLLQAFALELEQEHGKLDCLINNAGFAFKVCSACDKKMFYISPSKQHSHGATCILVRTVSDRRMHVSRPSVQDEYCNDDCLSYELKPSTRAYAAQTAASATTAACTLYLQLQCFTAATTTHIITCI
jgi:hypothetical protein